MNEEIQFDDIRSYRDEEIPAAMQRIADSAAFPLLAAYVFPDTDIATVREMVRSIRTIDEFQSQVMFFTIRQVISRTITRFTFGGLEQLSPDRRYLFISNHRDIALDSALLQYVLHTHGHETTEITFGANLMQNQLIVDIGRSNKMFRVERPGNSLKAFYRSSLHLSQYIRHKLCHEHHSVWIAQRNGRTKDGLDLTDQGVIKMLGMSRPDNKLQAIAELNIVPVAISYEWEPCDLLKTIELYERRQMGNYIKKPGEDINSILTGFVQPKGEVHLQFCPPLQPDELAAFDTCTLGDFNRTVAHLIDNRIHQGYHLTSNNYIAHDLRYGRNRHAGHYTEAQKAAFVQHAARLKQFAEESDPEALSDIFLGIYSNPVDAAGL